MINDFKKSRLLELHSDGKYYLKETRDAIYLRKIIRSDDICDKLREKDNNGNNKYDFSVDNYHKVVYDEVLDIIPSKYPDFVKDSLQVNKIAEGYGVEVIFQEDGVDEPTRIGILNICEKLYYMSSDEFYMLISNTPMKIG